ncbi:MAG: SocA family protein [Candidatus Marinimicrobia bacterium]|nr:SocA family protein [Candidatus Neomarinimicrobiota bacterium]
MIKFKFNKQKSIEAVLYLISKSGKNTYDLYKIVKMIFEADKYHLNHYMRPVTGDYFVSMAKGIVPSNIYDLCKGEDPKEAFYRKSPRIIVANRIADCNHLSESDIEALDQAYEKLAPLTFGQICEQNHNENPAWGKNYVTGSSSRIDFAQIIDDPKIIKELKDIASNMVI